MPIQITFFQLTQAAFSIFGIVAFIKWLMHFFADYRATMKDALTVKDHVIASQREAMQLQKQKYLAQLGELRHTLQGVEQAKTDDHVALTIAERHEALVSALSRLHSFTVLQLGDMDPKFMKLAASISTAVIPYLDPKRQLDAWSAIQHGLKFDDPLVCAAAEIYKDVISLSKLWGRLSVFAEITAISLPELIHQSDNNPSAAPSELIQTFLQKMIDDEMTALPQQPV